MRQREHTNCWVRTSCTRHTRTPFTPNFIYSQFQPLLIFISLFPIAKQDMQRTRPSWQTGPAVQPWTGGLDTLGVTEPTWLESCVERDVNGLRGLVKRCRGSSRVSAVSQFNVLRHFFVFCLFFVIHFFVPMGLSPMGNSGRFPPIKASCSRVALPQPN